MRLSVSQVSIRPLVLVVNTVKMSESRSFGITPLIKTLLTLYIKIHLYSYFMNSYVGPLFIQSNVQFPNLSKILNEKLSLFYIFQTLLPAANLLQLVKVRDACCEFLQGQLHPSNCLGIRAFADLHSCTELLQASQSYTEQHFR